MGIIGGADGPTVIFVTSSINWLWVIVAAVITAGIIAAVIIRKKKKK